MENSVAAGTVHRDMRPGLIIFGIISILLGVGCLLMVPLMIVGSTLKPQGGQEVSWSMMVPSILIYLGIAVVNIWLGIGSILCRRWARALMLLYSLFWMLTGLISIVMMLLLLGDIQAAMQQMSGSNITTLESGIMVAMFAIMGIIYVVIPGSFTVFYVLRSTRLTCEARDPRERWTDQCPLPLLGLVLLHAMMAACFPTTLLYAPIVALFGKWVPGVPAVLTILGIALVYGCCAWGLFRRMRIFWALALGTSLLVATSYMVTLMQTGLMEIYRQMEMPAETMKMLEQMPFVQNKSLAWLGLLYLIPYAGWMVWCLRYFPARAVGD